MRHSARAVLLPGGRPAAVCGAMASALARTPLPPSREGLDAAPAGAVSERAVQQALLALDSDNRTLRRKLADAGACRVRRCGARCQGV